METMPDSFPYLFYGYAVIWLIFGIFLSSLVCRMRRVEKKLSEKGLDSACNEHC